LSCKGTENLSNLFRRLEKLPHLTSLKIILQSEGNSGNSAREFLQKLLPAFGQKITGLHLAAENLDENSIALVLDYCQRLRAVSLDVDQMPADALMYLFKEEARAMELRSLRLCGVRMSRRTLLAIARSCRNLEELEVSKVDAVDDR